MKIIFEEVEELKKPNYLDKETEKLIDPKEATNRRAFIGAKNQPLPKEIEMPKSALGESLVEGATYIPNLRERLLSMLNDGTIDAVDVASSLVDRLSDEVLQRINRKTAWILSEDFLGEESSPMGYEEAKRYCEKQGIKLTKSLYNKILKFAGVNKSIKEAIKNPHFNAEKYGKYFDENGQLIPELADEYWDLIEMNPEDLGSVVATDTDECLTEEVGNVMSRLWDMLDDEVIDASELAKELMKWLGEDELKKFNNEYEYIPDFEDDEENESLKECTNVIKEEIAANDLDELENYTVDYMFEYFNDLLNNMSKEQAETLCNDICGMLKDHIEHMEELKDDSEFEEESLEEAKTDREKEKAYKEQRKGLWDRVYSELSTGVDTAVEGPHKIKAGKNERYDDLFIPSNGIGVYAPTEDRLSFAKKVADYFGLDCKISAVPGNADTETAFKAVIVIPDSLVDETEEQTKARLNK